MLLFSARQKVRYKTTAAKVSFLIQFVIGHISRVKIKIWHHFWFSSKKWVMRILLRSFPLINSKSRQTLLSIRARSLE